MSELFKKLREIFRDSHRRRPCTLISSIDDSVDLEAPDRLEICKHPLAVECSFNYRIKKPYDFDSIIDKGINSIVTPHLLVFAKHIRKYPNEKEDAAVMIKEIEPGKCRGPPISSVWDFFNSKGFVDYTTDYTTDQVIGFLQRLKKITISDITGCFTELNCIRSAYRRLEQARTRKEIERIDKKKQISAWQFMNVLSLLKSRNPQKKIYSELEEKLREKVEDKRYSKHPALREHEILADCRSNFLSDAEDRVVMLSGGVAYKLKPHPDDTFITELLRLAAEREYKLYALEQMHAASEILRPGRYFAKRLDLTKVPSADHEIEVADKHCLGRG